MRRDDAKEIQPAVLSPHARDLYRALIAGRRLEPDHPLLQDWRRMRAAASELKQNCKVRL